MSGTSRQRVTRLVQAMTSSFARRSTLAGEAIPNRATVATSSSSSSRFNGRSVRYGTVTFASAAALALAFNQKEDTITAEASSTSASLSAASTLQLLRSYFVWTILGVPSLVDSSPAMLDYVLHSSIPGLSQTGEAFIRQTFFPQFIPGETAEGCVPAMEKLRRRNVGSALNYSAEADVVEPEAIEALIEARFKEVETAIDVQGEFEERMAVEGWARGSSAFALKTTGLMDPAVFVRASNTLHRLRVNESSPVPRPGFPGDCDALVLAPTSTDVSVFNEFRATAVPDLSVSSEDPGLQPGDLEHLQRLWLRLDSLAARAKRNGVRLILDAEESYYEPVMDGYVRMLSMKYNRPPSEKDKTTVWTGPVVYGSYQCYLQRQPTFLASSIKHAEKHGYALGVKVVRGGYIVKEHDFWKTTGRTGTCPVWPTKPETDKCYNHTVSVLLKTLKRALDSSRPELAPSVIFGTHNIDSVATIIKTLGDEGLAYPTSAGKLRFRPDALGRVCVAQLYGMRDDLSDLIQSSFEASKAAMSMTFIAYGSLRETLPFLSRRAIENKSIMRGNHGAAVERRRVGAELRRRLSFGFL